MTPLKSLNLLLATALLAPFFLCQSCGGKGLKPQEEHPTDYSEQFSVTFESVTPEQIEDGRWLLRVELSQEARDVIVNFLENAEAETGQEPEKVKLSAIALTPEQIAPAGREVGDWSERFCTDARLYAVDTNGERVVLGYLDTNKTIMTKEIVSFRTHSHEDIREHYPDLFDADFGLELEASTPVDPDEQWEQDWVLGFSLNVVNRFSEKLYDESEIPDVSPPCDEGTE